MSGIVKALEWEDCDDLGLCADTIIGRYWMEPDDLQSTSWQLRLITIKSEEEEQLILARGQVSAAATQAFAQADIEKRINSVLDPSYASSQAEIESAKTYLRSLLTSFVKEHCDPVPEWAPLPDLLGMLTQIDNAITVTRDRQAEIERLGTALDYAAKGLDMIHNGLMDPTRPRQSVGEVCAHFLDAANTAALSGGKP